MMAFVSCVLLAVSAFLLFALVCTVRELRELQNSLRRKSGEYLDEVSARREAELKLAKLTGEIRKLSQLP